MKKKIVNRTNTCSLSEFSKVIQKIGNQNYEIFQYCQEVGAIIDNSIQLSDKAEKLFELFNELSNLTRIMTMGHLRSKENVDEVAKEILNLKIKINEIVDK